MRQNAKNISPQDTEQRIPVKVVSQVQLVVQGNDIFQVLLKRVLQWASNQENLRNLPETAWKGNSFEIDHYNSERAEAIKLDGYWAFRLHLHLKDPSRTWIIEVGIGERSSTEAVFGVRLICVPQRGTFEPIRRSIPNFVRGIVFTQNTCLDSRKISADPWFVDSEQDVDELVAFLQNPSRHHPVVVFSIPEDSQNPDETIIPTTPFIRRTAGFVHTVVITSNGAYTLTERLGREFSVFRQAVRTYNPGFDSDISLPTDHPLATAARITNWNSEAEPTFTDFLVEQTLRPTRPRHILEKNQPSFQHVKSIAKQQTYQAAADEEQEISELLRLNEEQLQAVKQEAKDWFDEAAETETKYNDTLSELRQLRGSYIALQARLDALLSEKPESVTPDIPDILEDIESWADKYLSGQVWLHPKAVKAARNSNFQDVALVYNALLMMRDLYVPMRRDGGLKYKEAFKKQLAELRLEDTRCFAQKISARKFPDYFIPYQETTRELDWHLKGNSSRDRQRGFRLYYFWDAETSRVVVGHLPGHLKTGFT